MSPLCTVSPTCIIHWQILMDLWLLDLQKTEQLLIRPSPISQNISQVRIVTINHSRDLFLSINLLFLILATILTRRSLLIVCWQLLIPLPPIERYHFRENFNIFLKLLIMQKLKWFYTRILNVILQYIRNQKQLKSW